jgi:hypothetical protein
MRAITLGVHVIGGGDVDLGPLLGGAGRRNRG